MKLKSKTLEYLKKTSIIEFNFEFNITDVFLVLLLNVRVVHVRVLPRSSAHFLQNILPARFKYASLVALVELYRN